MRRHLPHHSRFSSLAGRRQLHRLFRGSRPSAPRDPGLKLHPYTDHFTPAHLFGKFHPHFTRGFSHSDVKCVKYTRSKRRLPDPSSSSSSSALDTWEVSVLRLKKK
ncbi:unnamed protein product [Knipowitschia caucasica]|uniref:Uncharacterized protein n=1 Tax=Knipowitschia caucasica TaxID=637954 RepID=A0AAV2MNM2_KNICA